MEVALPRDLEQHASLAKRRHAELCRQRQIFNARNRIVGGDTGAWDVQVHDQKIKEATEKARHETFAAEMRQNDKIMCVLEDQERRDRKNLCRVISDFQQSFQKPETRREFDLSDPLVLKKDLPARQSDNDIRNTISGMQKFMGEDLNFHERNARINQNRAEDFHTETRLQFDETAKHLQKLESATRKAVCAAVKEFNKNQAMEAAEKKKQERKQEQEDNLSEIANLLRGDLLSENPQQAASSFGPHRVVPDRWKGMTQEQLEQIRLVQKQQVQEKLRLQEEERQRDMDWDQRRIQSARATLLFERQQQRWQRDLSRALDSSNLSLAKEQQLQKKYMNEVYANQPTEDYFTQFNTTSR
ncbi:PREDICTED: RIB43A-like with coiled-coils protein 2 [Galeopterus variegatus]|uniref:RIB43A-like with coiled-coils protein 2 n=1 Tax=Galeopterus variegatus TaxID=482537 RepID=A0ABM0RK51_GALVR|nr:PREDICTED: RIB43A-like with coiled-coils protein 2 [Galeopterus variegatus]